MKGTAWVLVLLTLWVPAAHAVTAEETLATVAFDQRIGSPLPRAALLSLEAGRLTLAELSEDQPLVLVLSWFECPNLCPMVLDQLAAAARRLPFEPGDYQVAVVSIDPGEGAGEARTLKARLRAEHGAVVADWQFLWGDRRRHVEHESVLSVTQHLGAIHPSYGLPIVACIKPAIIVMDESRPSITPFRSESLV